ncbi:MAG: hypothetical protein KC646_06300 [Candidatus Cloacimonetes bacterium]|nr:hypothetical protein [Candidatus Cloacimonadota bacterium]
MKSSKPLLYNNLGSILIILLWILTFLFFIGVEIQLLVQRTREFVQYEKSQLISKVASLSGIEYAKFLLVNDDTDVDHLKEKWAFQEVKKYKLNEEVSFELINKRTKKKLDFQFGLRDLESKLSLPLIPLDRWPQVLKLSDIQEKKFKNYGKGIVNFENLLQLSSALDLSIEQMMGEDQNDDGLLNENENDGDKSLPKDNFDDDLLLGLSDMLAWQSTEMNVNTIGSEQLLRLYPSKKADIDQFILSRSQRESGYTTLPSEFQGLFRPPKWFGVKSKFFVVRSIGSYKNVNYKSKVLLYKDLEEVYTLQPLVW